MTDNRDDELRDALREAFARKPPPDIVPPPELTAERLRHLDSMTGSQGTLTTPGKPIYAADGSLAGMTEPTSEPLTIPAPPATEAERNRLGVPDPFKDDPDDEPPEETP